jgi:hypothetical protein
MTIPTCPHARRDKTRLTAQLQTLPHFTANASNPMLGKFIRALLRPIAAQYGLFVALLLRNTGSLSPYCYAIRAPATAMCSLRCAHTPTLSPYLARCAQYGLFVIPGLRSAYPGLYSGALSGRSIPPRHICHICRRQMSIPPRHICHICRRQMSIPPRHICHICRRQMSIPPRHLWRGGWPTGRG